jgi:hypothetical protein
MEARMRMRSKIKFEGVWYKPVPWLGEGECKGCAMYMNENIGQCFNDVGDREPCHANNEFAGKIFIRFGKEALAEYIALKLS